ncbi:MAG: DNA gyrase subunit A, partial [Oscillospiraceae bacterium]|nr:DNA gyrase subunit A [Oscillospiraceae bacterium]
VIEYRRDVNGQIILNQLYKCTQMQDTCAINMLALVNNVPKVLGLCDILKYYIKHQVEVIERRVNFELQKALHEIHINEGYKIAVDNIDEVINIIRSSMSVSDARAALIERFELSDVQAQAIVEMTLGRLSGMERQKVEDRILKLQAQIDELETILADENKIMKIIREDLLEIKRRFGDERRTEIVPVENEIILEDLIERHTCLITMTHAGYIKRRAADSYTAQKRGGKGIIGMATKEEDFVEHVIAVNSHSHVLMFTNKGRIHTRKAYQIPEAARTSKGSNIVNILELEEGEKITALISVDNFEEGRYLIMVTKLGMVKRTWLSLYEPKQKGGKIALTLIDGDELVFVGLTEGTSEIMIATRMGYAVRFSEADITPIGRIAMGVKGIKLSRGDFVGGAAFVDESKNLIIITEEGYGKRVDFSEFMAHSRNTKGVICHKTEKNGLIAGIATVDETDDIMLITNDGTVIRTPAGAISLIGRNTGGVIIMRLPEGSVIVNIARLEAVEDEEEDEE